jgi:hypothetical protein
MKRCSKCKKELDESCFGNDKSKKDRLRIWCKKCIKKEHRKYYQENKEILIEYSNKYYLKHKKEILEYHKEYDKEYRKKHKEEKRKKDKIYRETHKKERQEYNKTHIEEIKRQRNNYRKKHKEERNKYCRNRRKNDVNYKIVCDMRTRMNEALHGEIKSDHTMELIGCDIELFKIYLQMTAIANGYLDFDINNYNHSKYHIDHIVPCSWFNMKDKNQQREAFNYKNCQILSAEENLKKHDKLI